MCWLLSACPPTVLLEHAVGATRTVTGDDVDGLLGAQLTVNLPQQIDERGVHGGRLVFAPVAQKPIDPFHGRRNVLPVPLEDDRKRFLGVDIVERDRPFGIAIGANRAAADHGNRSTNGHGCQDACKLAAQRPSPESASHPSIGLSGPRSPGIARSIRKPPAYPPPDPLDQLANATRLTNHDKSIGQSHGDGAAN